MIRITSANQKPTATSVNELAGSFSALLKRDDLGFFQIPERDQNWSAVKTVAEELLGRFSEFVFVGIGGSGLGGKTIKQAFMDRPESERLHFIENVDQFTLKTLMLKLDLPKTAWVFVSKSGSTLETLAIANVVSDELSKQNIKLEGRTVVISEDKPSLLTDWGKSIAAWFLEIPLDVGGRFSVLTPVGLLPAALLKLDLSEMREGARWALQQERLVCELAAQFLDSFAREEWITQFWIYSDRLATFGSWIQQLWAESLAKSVDRVGKTGPRVSTPMACVGAIDQHSLLQQVMEGARDKLVVLVRVKQALDKAPLNLFKGQSQFEGNGLQAILDVETTATRQALSEQGVSTLEISLDELSEKSLAALFMLFQLLIGTIGEKFNIDAFNQPGVELGKVIAKDMLTSK